MGDLCYICKKNFKWREEKITHNKIMSNNTADNYKEIPQGFAFGDNKLCSNCFNSLPIKIRIKNQESHMDESKTTIECHWCKKQKEEEQFALRSKWNLNDLDTCKECNNVLDYLTSEKLQKLVNGRIDISEKMELLEKLHDEATESLIRSEGVSTAESIMGLFPNSSTENVKNTSKENLNTLKLKLLDATQEYARISNLIKSEHLALKEKHFFNWDSNESQTKTHSTNTINTNEPYDDPLIILKIRLAKGEITLEEFNKIKENLV
jgi:phage gp16-like protein